MPAIEIRPALAADISTLSGLDHSYITDYVWQMDIQMKEECEIDVAFREIRLPRSARVATPHAPNDLLVDWTTRPGLLVSVYNSSPVGYVSMNISRYPKAVWITELVVQANLRRQGIGSALILAAQNWARSMDAVHIFMEIQPKNYPAIQLAKKVGFYLCGYHDRYFNNRDIALFFAASLR